MNVNYIQNISVSLFLFLGITIFSGCNKENRCDCFKTTGNDITINRDISSFDTVFVKDKVDVYLIEDSIFKIEIVGGANLVALIKTDITNNKLSIRNENKCNVVRSYKRKIKVYVHAPKLKGIIHRGVGNIYCENELKSDTIFYQVFNSGDLHLSVSNIYLFGGANGIGDVHVKGNCTKHLSNINGEGFLFAEELKTNFSDLYLKTSGTSKVYATDELRVVLTESGDLYYKGNPSTITKTITGTGQLIHY